ncbi:MAG: ATP-binding protein [Terricaulis sp.]
MNRLFGSALTGGRGRFIALAAAMVLVLIGILMAIVSEESYKQQKSREIGVQAQIIAASVAPALMFDNGAAAQEYLQALRADPAVEATAIYDANGARVAAYGRADEPAAPAKVSVGGPVFAGRSLAVVTPIARDGEKLGSVYLRIDSESTWRRFSRYAGVGVLILLAALVVTVFGLAQSALEEANVNLRERAQRLQQEIEQRERAEEALLQSRKLEAIGQLTGGVAHDFNNLLTVVLSGLRLIERNPDPQRRASTMEAMRQAVERGAGLTRQLLAFSRRQSLTLEPIDVHKHLQGMRSLLERSLRADILVDIITPHGLWPVKTDPTQFELAILNLAVNARDAMPKGGVLTITAANAIEGAEQFVEIEVHDTGVGMAREVAERVFEPYFTTKPAGQGTGLGLSQVYGIVTQSGGRAAVESEIDRGTTVRLLLPRSKEEPAVQAVAAPAPAQRHIEGKKVLVVEDDDTVAAMVGDMLQQMGCKPTRVANAEAALDALAGKAGYDLVFSDIVMPGQMNGVDLAHEIHRRDPVLPIVLTTGFSGQAQIDPEFPLLRKPYQFEDLETVVSQALRR